MKNPLQCKTEQRVRRLPARLSRGLSGSSRIPRKRDALIYKGETNGHPWRFLLGEIV
jgi:hypothetical protein